MTSAAGDQVRDLPAVGVGISDSLIKMGVGRDDNVRVLSALVKSLLQNVAQRLQAGGGRRGVGPKFGLPRSAKLAAPEYGG
jgi:hypothetical protein